MTLLLLLAVTAAAATQARARPLDLTDDWVYGGAQGRVQATQTADHVVLAPMAGTQQGDAERSGEVARRGRSSRTTESPPDASRRKATETRSRSADERILRGRDGTVHGL